MWKTIFMVCLGRPYHFKFFKGCLLQIYLVHSSIPWPIYYTLNHWVPLIVLSPLKTSRSLCVLVFRRYRKRLSYMNGINYLDFFYQSTIEVLCYATSHINFSSFKWFFLCRQLFSAQIFSEYLSVLLIKSWKYRFWDLFFLCRFFKEA